MTENENAWISLSANPKTPSAFLSISLRGNSMFNLCSCTAALCEKGIEKKTQTNSCLISDFVQNTNNG